MSYIPVEFSQLAISLAQSVLVGLGEVPDSQGQQPMKNLDMARHSFGVLQMLKEKTIGNLDEVEEKLLEELLKDLTSKMAQMEKN
jgi:hypothetical protein